MGNKGNGEKFGNAFGVTYVRGDDGVDTRLTTNGGDPCLRSTSGTPYTRLANGDSYPRLANGDSYPRSTSGDSTPDSGDGHDGDPQISGGSDSHPRMLIFAEMVAPF